MNFKDIISVAGYGGLSSVLKALQRRTVIK